MKRHLEDFGFNAGTAPGAGQISDILSDLVGEVELAVSVGDLGAIIESVGAVRDLAEALRAETHS